MRNNLGLSITTKNQRRQACHLSEEKSAQATLDRGIQVMVNQPCHHGCGTFATLDARNPTPPAPHSKNVGRSFIQGGQPLKSSAVPVSPVGRHLSEKLIAGVKMSWWDILVTH